MHAAPPHPAPADAAGHAATGFASHAAAWLASRASARLAARPPAAGPSGRPGWQLRFAALTGIWGASFLFIKLGVEAFAPLHVALGRMVVGAAVLLAVLGARRERLPSGVRLWGHLAASAFLLNALPFTLFAYAEQRVPSSLAGACNATTPLFTLVASLIALPDERPTLRRGAGLALGFAGALLVLGAPRGPGEAGARAGALLALAASACYGVGYVYVRRFVSGSRHSSLALSAAQLVAGALELALAAPAFGPAPRQLAAPALLAVFALGALGTGAAYVLQHGLIRDAGPTVASTVSYFVPIASLAVGAVALGERPGWGAPLGAAVIVAGALVSRRAPDVRLRRPASAGGLPRAGLAANAAGGSPEAGRGGA